MWHNPQKTATLVAFTEEILNPTKFTSEIGENDSPSFLGRKISYENWICDISLPQANI